MGLGRSRKNLSMPTRLDDTLSSKTRTMLHRMWRVARLDRDTIEDLKSDSKATPQAVAIVLLAGLSYGLGVGLFLGATLDVLLFGLMFWILLGLLTGFLWLSLTFVIGRRLFRGETDYWGLARPFFFAWSPGLLFVLMSVPTPLIAGLVRAVVGAWIIISSVFVVKYSMSLETQQSLMIFILVFFVLVAILILIGSISPMFSLA